MRWYKKLPPFWQKAIPWCALGAVVMTGFLAALAIALSSSSGDSHITHLAPVATASPTRRATPTITKRPTATLTLQPTQIVTPVPSEIPRPQPTLGSTPNPAPIMTPEPPPPPQPTQTPTFSAGLDRAEAQRLIDLINGKRAENQLPLLRPDPNDDLRDSGEKRVTYLWTNNAWGHCNDYDGDGDIDYADSPQGMAEAEGYVGGVGEVLTGDFSPEGILNDWMNSQPHRDAILNPAVVDIGVGYYNSSAQDIAVAELGIPGGAPWHLC